MAGDGEHGLQTMAKIALLIGVSEYEPGLSGLPGAPKDVAALQVVLENPQIGGFDQVSALVNPEPQAMQEAIELIFADRTKDDLVLLFFSGHGVKDDQGRLYFATPRTRKTEREDLIKSTTVTAGMIHDYMSNSRAKRQVVILDCCFSGAFAQNMPAKSAQTEDISADIRAQLGAEGRAVLTSSTATQYSLEQPDASMSVYTRYLVEGLATGAADAGGDGEISVDELHEYARSKVQEAAPAMKPEIYAVREGYKIKLARAALGDPRLIYRKEVEELVRSSNGEISYLDRPILEALRRNLRLSAEVAGAIEVEVQKPYEERQQKIASYAQAWREVIQRETEVTALTRTKLKRLQQTLRLRDEDVAQIEAALPMPQRPPAPPPPKPSSSAVRAPRSAGSPNTPRAQHPSPMTRQQFLQWASWGGGGVAFAVAGNTVIRQLSSQPPESQPSGGKTPQTASSTQRMKAGALSLQTVDFKTASVDKQGKVTQSTSKAKVFKEDLGGGVDLEMVAISGGSFQMGTAQSDRDQVIQEAIKTGISKDNAEKWVGWEMPQHPVTIAPFYLGQHAVTQAQWKIVAGWSKANRDLNPDPANFKGPNRPVEQVSWEDAVEFCARLSQRTGKTYRLPSEAEWEYACRAGTTTPFHFGDTLTPDLANYDGNDTYGNGPKGTYRERTTDVGSFPANAFGLCDMHGNVREWCGDRWHENYQGAPKDGSVWDQGGDENLRLLRGCSWLTLPWGCRSACRYRLTRDERVSDLGFRVACAAPRTL